MDPVAFRTNLLNWYADHRRDLPWRHTRDTYPIWLSEIILQQTRVAQGWPYWERFMEAYPTLGDLATAEEQEVLRLWQGLGYYSRARNLHACAKQVHFDLGGQWPDTYDGLLQLKGVGKYTAAAIASFAFDRATPVVDGNVFRLFSRVFGIDTDIASSGAFKEFFKLGEILIDPEHPADFNQATMEFGSTYCKPQNPPCLTCPLAGGCHARATGTQAQLPVKSKKTKVRNRYFSYLVFRYKDQWLVKERTQGDIWSGLYDFYLVETPTPATPEDWPEELRKLLRGKTLEGGEHEYKHLLSHQRLHAHFYVVHLSTEKELAAIAKPLDMRRVDETELEKLPKPVLILKFLEA